MNRQNARKISKRPSTSSILSEPPRQPLVLGPFDKAVTALPFAPDGKTLASAGADGRLVWRHTDTWEEAGECAVGFPVHSMSFAPDGRHVVTGNANGTIYVFRLAPAPP